MYFLVILFFIFDYIDSVVLQFALACELYGNAAVRFCALFNAKVFLWYVIEMQVFSMQSIGKFFSVTCDLLIWVLNLRIIYSAKQSFSNFWKR